MSGKGPFVVVTVLLDGAARPAAVTRAHGVAMERAFKATAGVPTAGLDLAELPIATKAFENLRRGLGLADDTVALYDVFPLSAALDGATRRVAGQFLAAEALWALEEQGMLKGVPPAEKFDLPHGWNKDPREIRKRLVAAGAHELGPEGITAFQQIKQRWDASPAA